MPGKSVIYISKDHIGWITINRPEEGNKIDLELAQEIMDVCNGINEDDDVYLAVITGAGDKDFCGGIEGEIKVNIAEAIADINKPVIAAINGDATGEGLELALSCDIRIASDTANFCLPQIASGNIPMNGGTQRLPRLIGKGKAIELILTGETIDAAEAFNIGLVSKVVKRQELMKEVESIARDMATNAPISLQFVKEAVNKGMDFTLDQGLRLESDLYFLLHTTADRTEGIEAFLEKRKPEFKGE